MRDITSATPPAALSSVSNALRAVRLVEGRGTISVTELSQELGVGRSTAHRLLSSLLAEGFVVRDPLKRTYHSGGIFIAAGLTALGPLDMRRRVHTPLLRLAEKVREYTYCTVLDGATARVVHDVYRERSSKPAQAADRHGALVPAHASPGTKLLLAQRDPAERRRILGPKLESLAPRTITDWDALDVELAQSRARRWAITIDEAAKGISGLAVLIPGFVTEPYAALNVGVPTDTFTPDRRAALLRALFEAAEEIGRAAGAR